MNVLSHVSLRLSLPLIIAIAGTASMTSLAYSEWVNNNKQLDEHTRSRALFTSHIASTILEEALATGDYPRVKKLLQPIMADRLAVSGVVVDQWNTPIIDLVTHRPEQMPDIKHIQPLLEAARNQHSVQVKKITGTDKLFSVAPLAVGAGKWHSPTPYSLIVVYDLAPQRAAATAITLQRVLRRSCFLLLVVSITWLLLHQTVVARVAELIKLTRQISQGNFGTLQNIQGSDELSQLGESLHRMSSNLSNMHSKLVDSEAHYRRLVEQTKDMIAIVDQRSAIIYASPAIRQILNWHPDEVNQEYLLDLIHPDDRSDARDIFQLAQTGATAKLNIEVRMRSRSGNWQNIECNCSQLTGTDQNRTLMITARDISERRLAEARIRASEILNRTLVRHAPFALMIYDPKEDRITLANPEAKRIFAQDPIGWKAADIWQHSSATQPNNMTAQEYGEKLLSSAQEKPTECLWLVARNEANPTFCRGTLMPIKNGGDTQILWALSDQTETNELKLALERRRDKIQTMMESLPESVTLLTAAGGFIKAIHKGSANDPIANPEASYQLNDAARSLLASACQKCIENQQDQKLRIALQKKSDEEPSNEELEQTRLQWAGHLIPYRHHNADVVLCITRTVSANHRHHTLLRQQFREIHNSYENSPALLLHVDSQQLITSINHYGAGQLGYKAEDLIGQPAASIFLNPASFAEAMRDTLGYQPDHKSGYLVFKNTNGSAISAPAHWHIKVRSQEIENPHFTIEIAALLPSTVDAALLTA